jgi:hypothetical protein
MLPEKSAPVVVHSRAGLKATFAVDVAQEIAASHFLLKNLQEGTDVATLVWNNANVGFSFTERSPNLRCL